MNPDVSTRRGLVLIEAMAASAIALLLAVLLTIWATDARRQASLSVTIANLEQFGEVTAHYGADYADRMWTFSWRGGEAYDGWFATDDMQAAANQAVDIMRRRGEPQMPQITTWLPHLLYSQLVLADYLDLELPQRWWVSPEDDLLRRYQDDPSSLPPGGSNLRVRFQSSYELGPAFYSPDAMQDGVPTIEQSTQHNQFYVGTSATPLGRRTLSEIRHPAQKVMMHDRYQRHFGPRQAFFGYREARLPVLMSDGSVLVRLCGDANSGFNPNRPTSPGVMRYFYAPAPSEPPTLSGEEADLVFGFFRWTRSGLRGRDFNGPEVPWVD